MSHVFINFFFCRARGSNDEDDDLSEGEKDEVQAAMYVLASVCVVYLLIHYLSVPPACRSSNKMPLRLRIKRRKKLWMVSYRLWTHPTLLALAIVFITMRSPQGWTSPGNGGLFLLCICQPHSAFQVMCPQMNAKSLVCRSRTLSSESRTEVSQICRMSYRFVSLLLSWCCLQSSFPQVLERCRRLGFPHVLCCQRPGYVSQYQQETLEVSLLIWSACRYIDVVVRHIRNIVVSTGFKRYVNPARIDPKYLSTFTGSGSGSADRLTLSTLALRSLPALCYSVVFVKESHVITPHSPRQDGNYLKYLVAKPFSGEGVRMVSTILMAMNMEEMKAQIEKDWISYTCRPLRQGVSD